MQIIYLGFPHLRHKLHVILGVCINLAHDLCPETIALFCFDDHHWIAYWMIVSWSRDVFEMGDCHGRCCWCKKRREDRSRISLLMWVMNTFVAIPTRLTIPPLILNSAANSFPLESQRKKQGRTNHSHSFSASFTWSRCFLRTYSISSRMQGSTLSSLWYHRPIQLLSKLSIRVFRSSANCFGMHNSDQTGRGL